MGQRNSPEMHTVELRFRSSKGDQERKEAVLMRTNGNGDKEGEAVNFLQEMYEINERITGLSLMV